MERGLSVPIAQAALQGDLDLPAGARGVVLFAHGSGSSRMSPRNRLVAARLRREGLGTFLFDLLTPEEEEADAATAALRFNIPLLAARLRAASLRLRRLGETRDLAQGYFGASTGAAAALVAAAEREVFAVVSRGGRPDLARGALARLRAPTLLIVGGEDREVLELNRRAAAEMTCEARLEVVPGATHLFEEPGTLEEAARLAAEWFAAKLP